jgi:hypothetical protein
VPGSRDRLSSLDWFSLARAGFARHRTDKPATKAGQVRALWPDIEAAIDGGQSMKSIRKWLEEDAGVTLSISSLTSYVSRFRRRLKAKRSAEVATGQILQPQAPAGPNARSQVATQVATGPAPGDDPLAQAKRVLSQPKLDIRKLHNDGDPEGRNLI